MVRKYDVIIFISKQLYFRRPRLANFAIMFIKTTFKDSKKLKELEIMH